MKKIKMSFLNKSKMDLYNKYSFDDNLIDIGQKQFLKQQEQLLELQNQLRKFIKGIMNITDIIDNMYSCFTGLYEPDWMGKVDFNQLCQESLKFWKQFIVDFKSNIKKDVDEYGQLFPEMKRSIDKRNKKLSELNKQKRIYQDCKNAKKVDENKIIKAKTELEHIEQEYNLQNNDLKETLPNFCDKCIQIYIEFWTKLFEAEKIMFSFLQENRKNQLINLSKLSNIIESNQYNLKSQINFVNEEKTNLISTRSYAKSSMALFVPDLESSESSSCIPFDPNIDSVIIADDFNLNRVKKSPINKRFQSQESVNLKSNIFSNPKEKTTLKKRISFSQNSDLNKISSTKSALPQNTKKKISEVIYENMNETDGYGKNKAPYATSRSSKQQSQINGCITFRQESFEIYANNNIQDNSKMVAIFDYQAQDSDELNLRKNDILVVLPWNDEEEKEDGWLFGENVTTKKKGIFPVNHTIKLES